MTKNWKQTRLNLLLRHRLGRAYICVVWTSGYLRKCSKIKRNNYYPLLELLLLQAVIEAPDRSSRRLFYLLVNFSWDKNQGGVGRLSPIRAVFGTRSFCAEHSQVVVSPRQFSWDPNWARFQQLTLIRAVVFKQNSCAQQSQVVVSPRRYFIRLPISVELAVIPVWSRYCHNKLLCGTVAGFQLLVVATWDFQPVWIWAAPSNFHALWTSVVSLQAALPMLWTRYIGILRTAFWELHQNKVFPHHRTTFERFFITQDQEQNISLQSNYRFVPLNL